LKYFRQSGIPLCCVIFPGAHLTARVSGLFDAAQSKAASRKSTLAITPCYALAGARFGRGNVLNSAGPASCVQ
jgi:hypothetical protein